MLDRYELPLMEELTITEPAEVLRAMPELRQWPRPRDEDLGLRSILERDEGASEAWLCDG